MQDQLKIGLSRLPAPKNDYEIVVPESEVEVEAQEGVAVVEDQGDVDALKQAEIDAESKAAGALFGSFIARLCCQGNGR